VNVMSDPEYVLPAIFTHYTGHGRDKLYRLIKAGRIRAKRTDSGRMLIEMNSIREYLASLPDVQAEKEAVDLFA
jgi:excisionase family DNA binding protein